MANLNLKAIITAEDKTSATFDKFGDNIKDTGKKTEGLTKSLGGMRVAANLAATAGLAILAKEVIDMSIQFDKATRNVNSIAKLSTEEFGKMQKQLMELSKTIPQTSTELAEGLYDVYSSGFKGAEAMEVLKVSAKGASAGLSDTTTSGRALMGVMNAYNLKTGPDANRIMDVLFKTVDIGVLTFEDLAQNIGDVVATSASAKISIEQIGAALATMTKKGISTSESTTALNMMILKFIKPTEEMSAALKTLGYESGLTAIQSDGLNLVLQKLWVQSGKNVEKFIPLFGEVNAVKGALSLAADGGAEFTASLDAMGKSSGATDLALKEQSKSMDYQYKLAKNQLAAVWMEIALAVLPTLTAGLQAMSLGFSIMGGWIMWLINKMADLVVWSSFTVIKMLGWFYHLKVMTIDIFWGIVNSIKGAFDWLAITVKTPFNKIIGFINKIITGINKFPGVKIGSLGYLAQGGFAQSGNPYIVGERGPELFIPSQSGQVVPNNKLGNQITVNFYGDLNNSSNYGVDEAGEKIARQIQLALGGVR